MTVVLPLFAAPLVGLAGFALDRRLRAARTRRQTTHLLALVPELPDLPRV